MSGVLLQTRVDPELAAQAEGDAQARGLTIAAWLRTVVMAHLQGGTELEQRVAELEGRVGELERHAVTKKGNGDARQRRKRG